MRLVLATAAIALLFACSDSKPAADATGAVSAPSGLQIVHEREGSGRNPTPTDVVKVHYEGTFTDGRVFDSSIKRGEPASFPLNRVIPCWTQGLQQMKVGGKAKLTCPPELAYGASGAPPTIPPNSTLIFEVELLSIE
jgi:FKBP-type peptidyl-prolyl cis-trans isomerase FkpA